uniref:RNase H type-1 domain-containing protein n=1 Tax=Lactuca sativa TaxID=4236 RepID=A0A9R1VJG7_LACSA|nr:hypothetical protein LSAT_V11C500254290 [Lactuca sativa]
MLANVFYISMEPMVKMVWELELSLSTPNLLEGLQLAQSMNISKVMVFFDSMLVDNQIRGDYELASILFDRILKKVLVEKLVRRSIEDPIIEAFEITEEEESWMTSHILFLKKGILPADDKEARKI